MRTSINGQGLVDRLADERKWPTVKTFHTTAGLAARALGFELRGLDRADSVTGRDKRWTGYPVGQDERSSLARFAVSFTLAATDGGASGPLVILGLAAAIDGGRVALTEAGWRLALAPNPLLGESGAGTLSDEERALLTNQVSGAPGERAAVVEFFELVVQANGSQKKVDELLGLRHDDWSKNRTTAHRAAMVGRLGELRMLERCGRGTSAQLSLLRAGERFSEESKDTESERRTP